MSTQLSIAGRLKLALSKPTCGVLPLVDELLNAAREQEILFDWHEGHCLIDIPSCKQAQRIDTPLGKSVARTVLARIAVLCNERVADSVSIYGGGGEIAVDQIIVQAIFTNTPDKQFLKLSPTEVKHSAHPAICVPADMKEVS